MTPHTTPPRSRNTSLCPTASCLLAILGAACVLIGSVFPGTAVADSPQAHQLLWQRQYVEEQQIDPYLLVLEVAALCAQTDRDPLYENGTTVGPKFSVIGDSVQAQTMAGVASDPAIRWRYATHCGENLRLAMDSGRLDLALANQPDVIVEGTNSNNYSTWFQPDPSKMPGFRSDLDEFLTRTSGVRCRVLFNIAERANPGADPLTQFLWITLHRQANSIIGAAASQPGVTVIDWSSIVAAHPDYVYDDQHLTRAGLNARINAAIAAGRHCWAPEAPTGVHAIAGNKLASVSWTPRPSEEGVTSYRVRSSLGHDVTTTQATVNVADIPNGSPVQFTVTSDNGAGTSSQSDPSIPVTPSAAGARFHPASPVRALDTRDGTGGKSTPFWPGETYELDLSTALPPEAANASAVVLNLTATGQTHDTFVTVFPGGDSRPLASNLNPRPGAAATPAMVTTRLGPGRRVQIFNNTGFVHLIADVIGWYGAPGTSSGALYTAVAPERVLDSRSGIGGRSTPFGNGESFEVALSSLPTGASAAVLNVTTTNTTSPGFVTLYPTGTSRPLASNLNPAPGLTRANLTTVQLGENRSFTTYNRSAATDVVIDLVGFYGTPGAAGGGAEYFPMTPERHIDTRDGTGGITGPVGNGADTMLGFIGRGSVPSVGVSAVDANLTVVMPSNGGHTTVWPTGERPDTSTLNYAAGEVVPNRDHITLNDGATMIWSTAPRVHYVIDIAGWFGPILGAGPEAGDTSSSSPLTVPSSQPHRAPTSTTVIAGPSHSTSAPTTTPVPPTPTPTSPPAAGTSVTATTEGWQSRTRTRPS